MATRQTPDRSASMTGLKTVLTKATPEVRIAALAKWDRAPAARDAHPREEHLLPLHVVVGAAVNDPGT